MNYQSKSCDATAGLSRAAAMREAKLIVARLIVDCGDGLLIEANPVARRRLGLAKPVRAPLPFDAAMPALQSLRQLAATPSLCGRSILIFWSAGNTHRWHCEFERASRQATRFALKVLHDAPAAVNEQPELPPVSVEAIARLAHELRAPVSAIFSAADVMAEGHLGPVEDERYHGYIVGIRDTARHLLGVVETMLQRPESAVGAVLTGPALADISGAVREVAHGLGAFADTLGVSLTVELAPGATAVVADQTGLRQMIYNLLSNAMRHAGDRARVTARTGRSASGEVWLEVEDDGPGIPVDVMKRALGRALRGTEAPDKLGRRAGLGLPLTRTLAEAAGASLSLVSDAAGTRARITFPADTALPSSSARRSAASP